MERQFLACEYCEQHIQLSDEIWLQRESGAWLRTTLLRVETEMPEILPGSVVYHARCRPVVAFHAPPRIPPGIDGLQRVRPKTPLARGGGLRARWKSADGHIYEWDYQHGTVEKYDRRGRHLAELDPDSGEQLQGPEGRRVEP